MLTVIIIYLVCGLAWMVRCIIRERSFDLDTGFIPNKVVYPLGISLWWFWMYQDLRR